MRDAATLLLDLVDVTRLAITQPKFDEVRRAGIEVLRGELEGASPHLADPAGGLLIDDEALLLAKVLCLAAKQCILNDERRLALLLQLAGVLLPAARAASWRAIVVRRDTRPTA